MTPTDPDRPTPDTDPDTLGGMIIVGYGVAVLLGALGAALLALLLRQYLALVDTDIAGAQAKHSAVDKVFKR